MGIDWVGIYVPFLISLVLIFLILRFIDKVRRR